MQLQNILTIMALLAVGAQALPTPSEQQGLFHVMLTLFVSFNRTKTDLAQMQHGEGEL